MIRRLALVLLGFALIAGAAGALLHHPGASSPPPVAVTSAGPIGHVAASPGAPGVAVPGGPSPTAARGQAPAVTSANRSGGGTGPVPMPISPSSLPPQGASAGAAGGSPPPADGSSQANSGTSPSTGSSAPLGTPGGLSLDVSCPGLQPQMKSGTTFTLTYTVKASSPGTLGLGAALYDTTGADQADGTGDVDAVAFLAGTTTKSRPVLLPSSLSPGVYEVDGELWAAHQIGLATDPLTSATCGDVTVTP